MNDATHTARPQPLMLRDVVLVLMAMALFLFALQPREHAHGERRRDAESVVQVGGTTAGGHWSRYDAEAQHDAIVRPAFRASL